MASAAVTAIHPDGRLDPRSRAVGHRLHYSTNILYRATRFFTTHTGSALLAGRFTIQDSTMANIRRFVQWRALNLKDLDTSRFSGIFGRRNSLTATSTVNHKATRCHDVSIQPQDSALRFATLELSALQTPPHIEPAMPWTPPSLSLSPKRHTGIEW